MYFDAEYGQSAPMNLVQAILLYGSERTIRLATVHRPISDPQGGPPLLDVGEPLTRAFLDTLVRGLGNEVAATFLPVNVLIYSSSLIAWWEPAQVHSMFFAPDSDGKTLDGKLFPNPPLLFAVRNSRLMVWALAEDRRPEPDTWLYMAPYWNTYEDGSVCHGSMPAPQTTAVDSLPQWSQAFFASRFTGSNLGIHQCRHPEGFIGMWRELAGQKKFPVDYLIRKRTLRETLCRNPRRFTASSTGCCAIASTS